MKPTPAEYLPGLEGYAKRDVTKGQWDTLPELSRVFAKWCHVEEGQRVLEPSCGIGNLAVALEALGAIVTGYELDPERAAIAQTRFSDVEVADFLTIDPASVSGVDLVAQNPPYEDDAEAIHVEHALRFAPRVCAILRLVSLASAARAPFWRNVALTRVGILSPRPVFAGTSGMDEIIFAEVRHKLTRHEESRPLVEWIQWRGIKGTR